MNTQRMLDRLGVSREAVQRAYVLGYTAGSIHTVGAMLLHRSIAVVVGLTLGFLLSALVAFAVERGGSCTI